MIKNVLQTGLWAVVALGLLAACGKEYTDTELYTMAVKARGEGAYDDAIDYLAEIGEKFPDSELASQSLFLTAYLYANELDDYVRAAEYYERFLAKYPNHDMAASARWEITNLGKDPEEILKGVSAVTPTTE